MTHPRYTFPKSARLVSHKLTDELFSSADRRSFTAYPLRAVVLQKERQEVGQPLQLLISVPKKHLHHAVSRNRVKRQVREAWRHHCQALLQALPADRSLLVAMVWQSDRLSSSAHVESRMLKLIDHIASGL